MEADIFLDNTHKKVTEQHSFLKVTPGIWINGKTYWLRDNNEKIIAEEEVSIHVKERSVHSKTKVHDVFVKNHGNQRRNIKFLFMHQYPNPRNELLTFVSPAEKAIFHVKNNQIYLVNGQCQGKVMEQMTVQPMWNIHTESIWQSQSDGILKYQPMAKGLMVSIFSLEANLDEDELCKASTWMVFGNNKNEVEYLNRTMKKQTSISF